MICMHIASFVCVKFMKFNHVPDSKISSVEFVFRMYISECSISVSDTTIVSVGLKCFLYKLQLGQ